VFTGRVVAKLGGNRQSLKHFDSRLEKLPLCYLALERSFTSL
jgi:hypothetical protein